MARAGPEYVEICQAHSTQGRGFGRVAVDMLSKRSVLVMPAEVADDCF